MGHDRASGVIRLASPAPGIFIDWDVHPNLPLYDTETDLSGDFAAALKGRPELNPLWKVLRIPVSVHNLGGCPMGETEGMGVVNPFGEVFEYPGLYVLDGSILPASTGANPSHTIAAVAERNVEAAIRKIRNDPQWQAPEMGAATQHVIPEPFDNVSVPDAGTTPPTQACRSTDFHRNAARLCISQSCAWRLQRRRARRARSGRQGRNDAQHHHADARFVHGR